MVKKTSTSTGSVLRTAFLAAFGIHTKKRAKAQTISYKRSGWWGKLSDAADRKAFNWKTREKLYAHLAAQVENGVAVESALDGFAKILGKRRRLSSKALVENVARRMRDGGMPLRRAISIAAPSNEVAIIAGGELSGELGKALDVLVASHDRVDSVMRAYKSAARNPLIYFALSYGLLWVIGAFVMPSITQALPEKKVSGIGIAMYKAADYSQSWLVVVPPILCVCLLMLIRYALPRWTGPKRIKAERYFPFSFYRDIEGYKWLTSFASMIQAGMTDVHILAKQMETASPWLRERLHHIRFRMTEGGMSLGAALDDKGPRDEQDFNFPNPDIIDRISSIEAFNEFAVKIGRTADRWSKEIEEEALSTAKKFGFYAEMFMYGAMGLLIVAINSVTSQLGTGGM